MLADDAVLFREGVARVLVDSGFEVVGQTGDGESILDLVTADPPDVVIIDLRTPTKDSPQQQRSVLLLLMSDC